MEYEIEFLQVGEGDCSGDAICMRWRDAASDGWRIGVIDGGYLATGEEVCEHIEKVYGSGSVDFVVSTHPDNDHMSGLRVVMERMHVSQLWMHVPYVHAPEIHNLFARQWSVDGLSAKLQEAYPHVMELMELAGRQGTSVYEPFQGAHIGPFKVLSPSRGMYNGLLPQFRDTPAHDSGLLMALGALLGGVGRRIGRVIQRTIIENWTTETLREGGTTAAENESSVVLYLPASSSVLLTGDVGLVGLNASIQYANAAGIDLGALWAMQVPHHGSRNNIAPSVLNVLLGRPVPEGSTRPKLCVVSAGQGDTTHPRQVVVNALKRRGAKVISTAESGQCLYLGNSGRTFNPPAEVQFSNRVEQYD